MKAFEVRKATVKPQYDAAMKKIEKAKGWGWSSTHIGNGTLLPEVAVMLANDGFDVRIVKRDEVTKSYNEVYWEYAEEGKEGTITFVDETQPKPVSIVVMDSLGLKKEDVPEPKKDEEATNKGSGTDSEDVAEPKEDTEE